MNDSSNKPLTIEDLQRLEGMDFDEGALLYFEQRGLWDRCDIYGDWLNTYNSLVDFPITDDDPEAALTYAAMVQSNRGAYASIAAALGIDAEDLARVGDYWEEAKTMGVILPPLGWDGLREFCERHRQSRENAGNSDDGWLSPPGWLEVLTDYRNKQAKEPDADQ